MTTPQTLKVDTALLAKAGQNFSAAAEAVPTAPTPYKPGVQILCRRRSSSKGSR
ncbi:Uncharacterised protein [Mycolicibacterium fortuitum]|uniref:Uncharacterized protein n=1 Tax=Mycolicibacterium fortuitum TaxID=1766 RepID=A0A378UW00_MYCFO|nr:Uncharacterised protein [Mycolicibacterium fortuitum]